MKAPFFLVGDGNVDVFQSVGDAECFIEPPDAGLYKLFDCEGREMRIEVRSSSPGRGILAFVFGAQEHTVLVEMENEPAQRESLAAYLRQYLARCAPHTAESVQSMSFDELISAFAASR